MQEVLAAAALALRTLVAQENYETPECESASSELETPVATEVSNSDEAASPWH